MEKNKTISLEEIKKLNKPTNPNIQQRENLTILDKIAVFITKIVGTMWCAIFFTAIALIALPEAISGGKAEIINWVTQTFLQLVLFSIIMVGQNLQNKHAQKRADFNYNVNVKAELEIETIIQHLENQNKIIAEILEKLDKK